MQNNGTETHADVAPKLEQCKREKMKDMHGSTQKSKKIQNKK